MPPNCCPRRRCGCRWRPSQRAIYHNFGYVLSVAVLERFIYTLATEWDKKNGSFCRTFVLRAAFLGHWDARYNQIASTGSSIATHKWWILFDPANLCIREWMNMHCRYFRRWEPIAFICRYWWMQLSRFSRHLAHDTGIGLDKPMHPILSLAMLSFGNYTLVLRSDAILLGNVTILGPGYMILHLSEGKKYRSWRSNLPTYSWN